MTVHKFSVALDEPLAVHATEIAEREGVSVIEWLTSVVERAITTDADAQAEHARAIAIGLEAVRDFQAEHGEFSDEALAWADEVLSGSRSSRVP